MNRKSSFLLLILPLFAILLILLLRIVDFDELIFLSRVTKIAKDVLSGLAILSRVTKKGMGCFVLLGDVLYGPHANTSYLMQLEQVF